jgi:hypothetical protein
MELYKLFYKKEKYFTQLYTKWEITKFLFQTYKIFGFPKYRNIKRIMDHLSFTINEENRNYENNYWRFYNDDDKTFIIYDSYDRIIPAGEVKEWLENYDETKNNFKYVKDYKEPFEYRKEPVPGIHTKSFKSNKNMHCFNKTELAKQLEYPTRKKRVSILINHDKWDILKHQKNNWKRDTKCKKQWERHIA